MDLPNIVGLLVESQLLEFPKRRLSSSPLPDVEDVQLAHVTNVEALVLEFRRQPFFSAEKSKQKPKIVNNANR